MAADSWIYIGYREFFQHPDRTQLANLEYERTELVSNQFVARYLEIIYRLIPNYRVSYSRCIFNENTTIGETHWMLEKRKLFYRGLRRFRTASFVPACHQLPVARRSRSNRRPLSLLGGPSDLEHVDTRTGCTHLLARSRRFFKFLYGYCQHDFCTLYMQLPGHARDEGGILRRLLLSRVHDIRFRVWLKAVLARGTRRSTRCVTNGVIISSLPTGRHWK